MVLRSVPPVPVTAFRDQQFLISQGSLLGGRLARICCEEVACCRELVPCHVVFRRADPYIEIRIDPRAWNNRSNLCGRVLSLYGFRNCQRCNRWIFLNAVV